MLVIAFDGILFDTLEFRATAVVNALAAEGIETQKQFVLSILPSRSLAEAVRATVQAHTVQARALQAHTVQTNSVSAQAAQTQIVDETTIDLAILRAEHAIREWGSRGATLNVSVRDRLRRAAAITRIVIRADSARHTVEQMLALADIDGAVAFSRCSDDVASANIARNTNSASKTNSASNTNSASSTHTQTNTHPHTGTSAHTPRPTEDTPLQRARESALTSIERSYEHIVRRMYANETLLGGAASIGLALEVCDAGRAIARRHGFGTPETFEVSQLHGR